MSNFNDINYLTGRRMQRNHNDAIADKDRAQHLKRSLKRHRKEDDRDDLYRDDANMYTKILRGRAFNPIRPNSNNKQRRVTTEPDLDIFGNEVHRQYPNRGIFGNSKCGLPYNLKPTSKQFEPKKEDDEEEDEEECSVIELRPSATSKNDSARRIFSDDAISARHSDKPLTTLIERVDKPSCSSVHEIEKDLIFNSSKESVEFHMPHDSTLLDFFNCDKNNSPGANEQNWTMTTRTSSISDPSDGPFSALNKIEMDPVKDNVQLLYQMISPQTYESIKIKMTLNSDLYEERSL